MIRDPSDGSVREPQKPASTGVDGKPQKSAAATENASDDNPLMSSTTSGLQTGSSKPENLARLEKSRTWIAEYRAKKSEGT
jgi:hypothetical protein